MWKAAFTELVATTCLLFTLTASIVACLDSHEADPKLLVPFTVFVIAFLFLMVTVPLSGGHMSPVFTFIAALKGIISPARAFTYILAQCVGSITGFLLLLSVMNHETAKKYSLGGCTIDGDGSTSGISPGRALILEFCCTFVVLFVGVTIAFDKRRSKELGLSMVCGVVAGAMAVAVFVSITVTGKAGYAGVGLNPARCLGPSLLLGGSLWDGHWIFWIGPCFACAIYYGFTKGLPKEGLVSEDEERDFINLVAPSLCCSGPRCRTQPHGKIYGNCETMNN
ncbi:Calcium-binding EF-hand family protein [Hibiscus syriacus]|uniref:Calcium-binding EF-hand family protein n=1 Tax=Hibiscus syriacus TaxID=106335 RepID=A0A6A2WVE8_HIBSY|nr:aquaporin TIP1-2-like [Hibiscus syriacus]KAE8665161.1 Calcium-binding EF-hand family protein [Hibiscus syriacus]